MLRVGRSFAHMEMDPSIWLSFLRLLKSVDLLPNFHSAEGIFCLLAWVSTLLMLGIFAMSMIGGLFESAEATGGGDVDGDTGSFSVRTVLGFALGFSWGGFIAIQSGANLTVSLAAGVGAGLLTFYLIAAMIRFIFSLRSDGTLNYASLKGMTGTVYVTLPPHGESGGQVQVSHPSQMITMAAVQYGDKPLPPQTRIEVTEASTSLLVVRPLDTLHDVSPRTTHHIPAG